MRIRMRPPKSYKTPGRVVQVPQHVERVKARVRRDYQAPKHIQEIEDSILGPQAHSKNAGQCFKTPTPRKAPE
jgi:hypothetical protein